MPDNRQLAPSKNHSIKDTLNLSVNSSISTSISNDMNPATLPMAIHIKQPANENSLNQGYSALKLTAIVEIYHNVTTAKTTDIDNLKLDSDSNLLDWEKINLRLFV